MPESFAKKVEEPETSPGGSVIHRYDRKVWSSSRVGFTDESTAQFAEIREQVYKRFLASPIPCLKKPSR